MDDLVRRLEIIETALFGRSGSFWHSIGHLSDGRKYGKVGSMVHIIDNETERPISKGYHSIEPISFSRYKVTLGAWEGEIEVERMA